MQEPLIYQTTEYDAAPAAVVNALRCLFAREEIPSSALKAVYQYTLDQAVPQSRPASFRTSAPAIRFLSSWLNRFSEDAGFPLRTEFYSGLEVFLGPGCRLYECLRGGGVAVLKVWYRGQGHYVTVTGMDADSLYLFDPCYREAPFSSPEIRIVTDQPCRCNRCVAIARVNQPLLRAYAAHRGEEREMLLFYRLSPRRDSPSAGGAPDDLE